MRSPIFKVICIIWAFICSCHPTPTCLGKNAMSTVICSCHVNNFNRITMMMIGSQGISSLEEQCHRQTFYSTFRWFLTNNISLFTALLIPSSPNMNNDQQLIKFCMNFYIYRLWSAYGQLNIDIYWLYIGAGRCICGQSLACQWHALC